MGSRGTTTTQEIPEWVAETYRSAFAAVESWIPYSGYSTDSLSVGHYQDQLNPSPSGAADPDYLAITRDLSCD